MRKIALFLAGIAITALAASPARADVIPYNDPSTPLVDENGYFLLDSPLGNPASELDWIEDLTGAELIYLNKYDYSDPEGYDNTGQVDQVGDAPWDEGGSGQANTKDISWDLSGTGYGVTYVLIKDGVVPTPCPPGADCKSLYRLYSVTLAQLVDGGGIVGFPPTYAKNISHVSWFGRETTDEEDPPPSVPDGGMTLTLLGGALFGLGVLRKNLSS